MNKIYLVESAGCWACSIMENLVNLVFQNNTNVKVEIIEKDNIPQWMKEQLDIVNYPTTVFTTDNKVLHYIKGSCTPSKLKEIAKMLEF